MEILTCVASIPQRTNTYTPPVPRMPPSTHPKNSIQNLPRPLPIQMTRVFRNRITMPMAHSCPHEPQSACPQRRQFPTQLPYTRSNTFQPLNPIFQNHEKSHARKQSYLLPNQSHLKPSSLSQNHPHRLPPLPRHPSISEKTRGNQPPLLPARAVPCPMALSRLPEKPWE